VEKSTLAVPVYGPVGLCEATAEHNWNSTSCAHSCCGLDLVLH